MSEEEPEQIESARRNSESPTRVAKGLLWLFYYLIGLFIGIKTGHLEAVVCLTYILIFLGGFAINTFWGRVAAMIAGLALILHFQGYKLYGAPKVVNVPDLPGSVRVVSIEPNASIQLANGEVAKLIDVYIPRMVKLTVAHGESGAPDATRFLWQNLDEGSIDPSVKVSVKPEGFGFDANCLQRRSYHNFQPTFLPARLPSRISVDFAGMLVLSQLALPSPEAPLDGTERTIVAVFADALSLGTPPLTGIVRKGDENAIALGRRMIAPGSRYFAAGGWLLVAAQYTDAYPRIAQEIHRRRVRAKAGSDEFSRERPENIDDLLLWVDYDETKRLLRPPKNSLEDKAWLQMATALASCGDLAAFDLVAMALDDPETPAFERGFLVANVPPLLRWPSYERNFSRWYASVRPRLCTGRDEFGGVAFWLEGGTPFDHDYLASIEAARK